MSGCAVGARDVPNSWNTRRPTGRATEAKTINADLLAFIKG